jgi:hypothetical protein
MQLADVSHPTKPTEHPLLRPASLFLMSLLLGLIGGGLWLSFLDWSGVVGLYLVAAEPYQVTMISLIGGGLIFVGSLLTSLASPQALRKIARVTFALAAAATVTGVVLYWNVYAVALFDRAFGAGLGWNLWIMAHYAGKFSPLLFAALAGVFVRLMLKTQR